jgi:hypothetical protein
MKCKLYTRADEIASPVSIKLGGRNIYAKDRNTLDSELVRISGKISDVASGFLTIRGMAISSALKKNYETDLKSNLFRAILGRQCRLGLINCVESLRVYFLGKEPLDPTHQRIFIHPDRADDYSGLLSRAFEKLQSERALRTGEVLEEFYDELEPSIEIESTGKYPFGMWFSAEDILCRLAALGLARIDLENKNFHCVEVMKDAKVKVNHDIYVIQ